MQASQIWVEGTSPALPEELTRGWLLIQRQTEKALASVFEMKDGGFVVIYTRLGWPAPHNEGPFSRLKEAQEYAEMIVGTMMVRHQIPLWRLN